MRKYEDEKRRNNLLPIERTPCTQTLSEMPNESNTKIKYN